MSVQGLPGPVRALAAGSRATCAVTQAGAHLLLGRGVSAAGFPRWLADRALVSGFRERLGRHRCRHLSFLRLAQRRRREVLRRRPTTGQFGNGPIDGSLDTEFAVGLAPGVLQIAGGGHHTCARNAAGSLQCWGLNTKGQLGTGSITRRLVPTQVIGLNLNVAAVAAGTFHKLRAFHHGRREVLGQQRPEHRRRRYAAGAAHPRRHRGAAQRRARAGRRRRPQLRHHGCTSRAVLGCELRRPSGQRRQRQQRGAGGRAGAGQRRRAGVGARRFAFLRAAAGRCGEMLGHQRSRPTRRRQAPSAVRCRWM